MQKGVYQQLITKGLRQALDQLESGLVESHENLPNDPSHLLAAHIGTLVKIALTSVSSSNQTLRQVELANQLLESLVDVSQGVDKTDLIDGACELLTAIFSESRLPGQNTKPRLPLIPLSDSTLLVNAHGEPSVGKALQSELESSDQIDLLCAFIKWSGLRLIQSDLQNYFERGGQLRVITTSYMGASDYRAVNWLAEQKGCQVRVSYNHRTTRLHAKSWFFHRNSGFSTAYIGSSNLSSSALLDGVEWNVRLSSVDNSSILEKFQATFDSYWEDREYEDFLPNQDHQERLRSALAGERQQSSGVIISPVEVRPYHYQQEILDSLDAERCLHSRWRNLVVAATGTGKTVIAALDYRRLSQYSARFEQKNPSLLFVAHRKEILEQAQSTFWSVLHRADFGERYVGGDKPLEWKHVFASIQSLNSMGVERFQPEQFDVVIVDEFHHAAASSYRKLLDRMRPKLLLGLTATPERHDEQPIKHWFDNRFAAELRLWSALEQEFLCPFHYFGIHDGVDLHHVEWKRTGYDVSELTNLYTANDVRANLILKQIQDKVTDVDSMKGLGFCVSVEHARFMSDRFNKAGVQAAWLDGRSPQSEREGRLNDLRDGCLKIIFAVDLFNEGVDIPEINTILLLRPTESSTLFIQQLGRGLRRADGKDVLTVLDFIGNAHKKFRYDLRYRALLGIDRATYQHQLKDGFSILPAGSALQLDDMAQKVVLDNLRDSLPGGWRQLKQEMAVWDPEIPLTIDNFVNQVDIDLEAIYRGLGHCWTMLKIETNQLSLKSEDDFKRMANGIGRLIGMDDQVQLKFLLNELESECPPQFSGWPLQQQRRWLMFHFEIWGDGQHAMSVEEGGIRLWELCAFRNELIELLRWLIEHSSQVHYPLEENDTIPLQLHAHYSRRQICAAIGQIDELHPYTHREGVWYDSSSQCDYFFVTLQKEDRYFSPNTRYNDYAISEQIFHWESQSRTREGSDTGQRYIHHGDIGSKVMLFVREKKGDPFQCLGYMSYQSHEGERPMAIRWQLEEQIPERSRQRYSLVS